MTTTAPSGYALDSAWHAERERLNSITALYDPQSIAACERIGVAEGWSCLDVGAGTGSLAELLAERVGEAGGVVALDVDTRFLDPIASSRLEVVRGDVTTEPLPSGFDLVHARLLLEHLPQRNQVLRCMVDAVRPGGWVLIEDFDWATAFMVDPPNELHAKVTWAIKSFFSQHGYEPHFGRRLPRLLQAAGLEEVQVDTVSIQVQADRQNGVPAWELLAAQFAPGMIAAGLVSAKEIAAFHELWHDGDTVGFAPLMVSAWGRK